MKKSFWLIFIAFFLIFPIHQTLAGTPYIVSEFIYEQNVLGRIIDFEGKILNTFWINSLDQNNGVDIACGDIDGDGKDEIVVASKSGLPKIKIYSQDGKLKHKEFLGYDKNYQRGISIALGDINMDGMDEIIVSSRTGNNPVKVYNYEGKFLDISSYPFTSQYHGSINITTGDVTGDGYEEIIASTGEGTRSEIKVLNKEGDLLPIQFSPFSSEFLGGSDVSTGDIEGDGIDEIVACQSSNGNLCKIYKYDKQQTILNEWSVFNNNSGVRVSINDTDRNGEGEVIVSTKDFTNQKIRVYRGTKEKINEINT
ncbi:MAG: VCBS repeat-containing protein, partial [Parcubacteria group bacterium]|nr:VCBS repeat-containing protein [Parcubacteria group bacterium]